MNHIIIIIIIIIMITTIVFIKGGPIYRYQFFELA